MLAPTIRSGGSDPTGDGDINLYISPEAQGKSWFDTQRRVIFVNGMANSRSDHASSARALSLLQACPVIGVYNQTDGTWADLGQCITDKANLVHVQAGALLTYEQWVIAAQAIYQVARAVNPSLSAVDFFDTLVAGNRATSALYRLLASGAVSRGATPIYCHSQGNLITSNALTTVAMALGMSSIANMEINSFGSPCRYWPPGINRTNNAFTFDPVSWLDLRMDLTSSKVGFVAGHAFTLYMQNDAEFVVNRFRWGSFGLTANMDEQGLARYMVRMGNNPPRLRGIFQRLQSAHWSDSDDVAYHYCAQASDALLRSIKASDAGLITLICSLLESGVTFPSERAQITRLQAL
ncbi:MAG: hypothetical protein ACRC14_14025 [Paracoccaceae bacterium]